MNHHLYLKIITETNMKYKEHKECLLPYFLMSVALILPQGT